MPVDLLGVAQAGANLVGDLQQQLMQRDSLRLQQQNQQLKLQQDQREQARLAEYRQAITQASQSGRASDIAQVMAQFPEFADKLKPSWEGLREDELRANRTQTGSAYIRASKGDYQGAAQIIKRRLDADRAAGQADEVTQQIYDALNSDNEQERKFAAFTLGGILAADDPETFKALDPNAGKTADQKNYEWRVGQFGKEYADRRDAIDSDKFVPVDGVGIYRASDLLGQGGNLVATPQQQAETARLERMYPNAPRGGDQSAGARVAPQGSAIEQAALAAVPGLTVTSRQRSPDKNKSVGGVQNSYHLTDQARDFVPPQGMTFGMLAKRLRDAMPGFDVINEGDHVHVEPGPGMRRESGPLKVRSIQEARKLPSGTIFITPDGRTMRKP